ncbi:MAG: hypothetical protein V1916_01675 [Patescibacteria group bacterium]
MSLKKYLILMFTTTLVCWVAWLFVVFFINPGEAGPVGFTLFYVSLFFACLGTFSLFGFFVRVWFSREEVIFRHLGVSSRQSLWFSILVIITLLLRATATFHWWSVALLIILLVVLEFFFISRKIVNPGKFNPR